MQIAFLTNDFSTYPDGKEVPGGCCYYRCSLPMYACGYPAKLGRPAFSPDHGFGVKQIGGGEVYGFDTVVLKLIMFRWTHRQMVISQQLGQRVIVDIDDAFDFLPEANKAWEVTHPKKNKVMNRDHYRAVIDQADGLIVSTPFLYEYHSKTHPDVRLVRNGVYPQMFDVKRQEAKPVLGWVGSIPFRGGDLETLREWLPAFLEEHDLMFHHSGDTVIEGDPIFSQVAGIPEERMTYTPQVPIDQYQHLFSHFDIGIVPLTDIPFNHAKSCIKGLEYAAAGIPFVAQDVPEYRMLADSGVGRVARSADDWVRHLTELLDYSTRRREAAVNRRLVEESHSIQSREADWRAAFVG